MNRIAICMVSLVIYYAHCTWYFKYHLCQSPFVRMSLCVSGSGHIFFSSYGCIPMASHAHVTCDMYEYGCSLLQSISHRSHTGKLKHCVHEMPHKWFDLSFNGDGLLPLWIVPGGMDTQCHPPFSHVCVCVWERKVNSISNGSTNILLKCFYMQSTP